LDVSGDQAGTTQDPVMKYYRSLPLAAMLAGAVALPAFAQTAPADAGSTPIQSQTSTASPPAPPEAGTTQKTDPANPVPDTGVRKAPPSMRHHHRTAHKSHLKTV
jgi:hypothetical protein